MQRNYMMAGVLLVIAAVNAWRALVERELPTFHLTIAGGATVLAVLVLLSRYSFPVRQQTAEARARPYRIAGIVLAAAGALAAVLWVQLGPWAPTVDFDVTAFLFIVQNIPQLAVLAALASVAFFGLWLARP